MPLCERDYILWKMWWIATLYGAGPTARMAALDRARESM